MKMVTRAGESRYPCRTKTVVLLNYVLLYRSGIKYYCDPCLVIYAFGDSYDVGTDIVLSYAA